jgi:hypothetical protein
MPPHASVWFDAQKAFTERDKTRNVENRVGREVMKLHSINEEKPTKKPVGKNRKAVKDKVAKH